MQETRRNFGKGKQANFGTSEVQKYGKVPKSTKNNRKVRRSTEKYGKVLKSTEKYEEVQEVQKSACSPWILGNLVL
jgi:hypothetical protein